jgi:hypothetical protein
MQPAEASRCFEIVSKGETLADLWLSADGLVQAIASDRADSSFHEALTMQCNAGSAVALRSGPPCVAGGGACGRRSIQEHETMIMWSPTEEALDDPFCPPAEPCIVFCLHCGQTYSSHEIVWRDDGQMGFWCCPVEGCDGKGFCFDIHPVDSYGEIFDEEEECDEESEDEEW